MEKLDFEKYFEDVETEKKYSGYFYSVTDAIAIAVLGSFCGLRDMKQIIHWASDERVRQYLRKQFSIYDVPCYSWYTQILGNIKPQSFSECFTQWIMSLVGDISNKTVSIDGKTVCSTAKMKNYERPLHIVSAQLAEYGVTIGQKAVDGKTNEIPTVCNLLEQLEIKGCMIVADAINCQKNTVKTVIDGEAGYILPVKGNQSALEEDIASYVADEYLNKSMDTVCITERNRDRIEKRTAYTTSDIDWLERREEWAGLRCIGAINTSFETAKGVSNEWHYYISSRKLSANDLLDYVRKEWSVESMHWLLDMRFGEDSFRASEQRTHENLNIVRKIVLNLMRIYKVENGVKTPFSNLMLDCLLNPKAITKFLQLN